MEWVALAIIGVFSLLGLSSSAKTQKPTPQEAKTPVVADGKRIRRIYGTVWVDDSIVLGFKQIGTDPIRTKGGKK